MPLTDDAARGRDRAVDVARLTALIVVMFGHCALLLATIDSGGMWIGNLLGQIPELAPLTWVVQVMPLFFLAGGAAGAYSWHADSGWGSWLFTRAQRLCRPVFWYLATWTAALLVVGATLGEESAAGLGRECVALLWFLGVYLVVLAFVPALTRLRTGSAVAMMVAGLLAAAAAVDGIRFAVGTPETGVANFLLVWLIPVVIGVAYARRLISVRAASVAAVSALIAQVALIFTGSYEISLVVTGVERVSNVSPPTLLLALHCTWMSLLFVAAAGPIQRWAQRPRVWRVVVVGNGGAMTLYLWHIPAIAIATFSLNAFGLDAYDVHAPGFWSLLAVRAVVFAAVMAVMFRLLSPLEHRRLPWWDGPVRCSGIWSAVAGAMICYAGVALVLMAKTGLTGVDGWAAGGCFVAAAAAARVSAGMRFPANDYGKDVVAAGASSTEVPVVIGDTPGRRRALRRPGRRRRPRAQVTAHYVRQACRTDVSGAGRHLRAAVVDQDVNTSHRPLSSPGHEHVSRTGTDHSRDDVDHL